MVDFKGTLLTLSDDAFFELIRNYLGPIKTPFNKHDLIAKLLAFLRKETTQEKIISLIDDGDAEILTAIWILDEPSHDDLFAFLESDHSFLELHNHLLNLEDRLLIYRDDQHIRLNPELKDRMIDGILHASRLFEVSGSDKALTDTEETPWLDDRLLISFFSFLVEEPELYRADGMLRKRSARSLAERIPALLKPLDPGGSGESAAGPERLRVDFLLEALLGLGLLVEEGSTVRPVVHAWHRWARITPVARVAEIAGAGATSNDGERGDAVLAAEALTRSVPGDMVLKPAAVARLASAATGIPSSTALRTVHSMMLVGLLQGGEQGVSRGWGDEESVSKPVVIGANFELTLPAETAFADGLFVGEVCRLVRHDRYPRFELTKERVASALRGGLGGSHIADRLSSLAGGALPQNVAISIRTWEEEYESIRLYRGVVLQVQEARRFTVEHSPAVQELIVQELAPGTYLIDESDVPELQQALADAGVELVPELPPADPAGFIPWHETESSAPLESRIHRVAAVVAESVDQKPSKLRTSSALRKELEDALAERKIPAEQRQELTERIQKKLIISPAQLTSAALKAERTEAKGLDYSGKVRVIEQSLSNCEYLEVIERTASGAPHRSLVEPHKLEKRENELILHGEELPDRKAVELQVSKLSLVRRLRAALFKRKPTE